MAGLIELIAALPVDSQARKEWDGLIGDQLSVRALLKRAYDCVEECCGCIYAHGAELDNEIRSTLGMPNRD